VEFVQVFNRENILVRVWERGSGETLACGTGACASVVASVLNKLTERKVKVNLTGGVLQIEWRENNNSVYLTGPAVEVFKGVYPLR
jgi:diaminopimelate epimerase